MSPALEKELREQLDQLAPDQQRQVLDFAKKLSERHSQGRSGSALARFAGTIKKDDLILIGDAIEAGCEQADPNEW
jgi:hypothetical protein